MKTGKAEKVWVDTPIGRLILIYMDMPLTLMRIFLPGQQMIPARMGISLLSEAHPAADKLSRIIHDALNGVKSQPPWEILSREGITPLQQAVYAQTAAIPYGGLSTYGGIAARIDRPKAFRFVGSVLARNPFPILIPCHRVIRSDNKLGGFGGGADLKQLLIQFEARKAPNKSWMRKNEAICD